MTEILFYHLTRQPLERALPLLLEKCLERGWRAVVQAASDERVAALDEMLWTYGDGSFLPHGTAADGHLDRQPIFLTAGDGNPNAAVVRVLVDGAEGPDLAPYVRALVLFDGHDAEAVAAARVRWRRHKGEGHDLSYWQQDDDGRWRKEA
ncbi:MAG TPA: DNA polymerase III subunit chi [Hyphomicrobiales bacterium]|nr:DNA polymerase III subunit chi [Hyphomicrobiales bacterium]